MRVRIVFLEYKKKKLNLCKDPQTTFSDVRTWVGADVPLSSSNDGDIL